KEVMPHVRRLLPGVSTYVIGSRMTASIEALAAPASAVLGYVPDIAPYLGACRVSISPLRYGAGVKGKVNTAMSHGLPVVATTTSVEGMHVVNGEDALIADDAEDFAEAIARAYQDEALWHKLSSAGTETIRRYFSRDVARSAV